MDRRCSSLSSTSRKTPLPSIFTTQTTDSESGGSTFELNRSRIGLDNSNAQQPSNVSSAPDDSTLIFPSVESLTLEISDSQSDDEVACAWFEDEDALRAATAHDTAQVHHIFQQTGQLLDDLDELLVSDRFQINISSSPNASTKHPNLRDRVSRFLLLKKSTRPNNETANLDRFESKSEIKHLPICSSKSDVDTFVRPLAEMSPRHTGYTYSLRQSCLSDDVEHADTQNTSTLHIPSDRNAIAMSFDATMSQRTTLFTSKKSFDTTYGPRITQQVFDELSKQQLSCRNSGARRSEHSQNMKKTSGGKGHTQGISPTMWAQS